jgi:hypothetical protein
MRQLSNPEEKIEELYKHLKEPSFKSFIIWKGELCTIKNFSLFKSIVLASLDPDYKFQDLLQDLRSFKLRFRARESFFQIIFPSNFQNLREQSRSIRNLFDKLDQIEGKQFDLLEAVGRANEKLRRAAVINLKIKEELRKSREKQIQMLEEIGISFKDTKMKDACIN